MDARIDTLSAARGFREPWNSGWTLGVDNDVSSGSENDRDYAGGVTLTLSGRRARDMRVSLNPVLQWLNRKTRVDALTRNAPVTEQRHSLQFGLLLFTPQDISTSLPIRDDRPYANLLFMSNTQHTLNPIRNVMYQSTFTLGLLGTKIGELAHDATLGLTGDFKPRGYAHQISDGGEPTFRYAVTRHSLLHAESELYISAGLKLRARAYNSLLQGQFRDSAVTFSASELNHVLGEAWVGVTSKFEGFEIDYTLRFQMREIEKGRGARNLKWGD